MTEDQKDAVREGFQAGQRTDWAVQALAKAARERWADQDNCISDSDLDNEQPVHITVTLGDLRRARATAQGAQG